MEITALVKAIHTSVSKAQNGNLNQNPPFKGKSDDCTGSLTTHAKQQLGKACVSAFYFYVCGYDSGKRALSLTFKGRYFK